MHRGPQVLADDPIAYLADAGDLDAGGDVEAQFLDWYQVRQSHVSGEVRYKAVLEAARVRARAFEEGRRAGLSEAAATLGWDGMRWQPLPGSTVSWTTSARGRISARDPE